MEGGQELKKEVVCHLEEGGAARTWRRLVRGEMGEGRREKGEGEGRREKGEGEGREKEKGGRRDRGREERREGRREGKKILTFVLKQYLNTQ
jgi:hypothetical protein